MIRKLAAYTKTRAGRGNEIVPSGAELAPFQPAGFGAGGATAVVGLFQFTLRLRHDFARFRWIDTARFERGYCSDPPDGRKAGGEGPVASGRWPVAGKAHGTRSVPSPTGHWPLATSHWPLATSPPFQTVRFLPSGAPGASASRNAPREGRGRGPGFPPGQAWRRNRTRRPDTHGRWPDRPGRRRKT